MGRQLHAFICCCSSCFCKCADNVSIVDLYCYSCIICIHAPPVYRVVLDLVQLLCHPIRKPVPHSFPTYYGCHGHITFQLCNYTITTKCVYPTSHPSLLHPCRASPSSLPSTNNGLPPVLGCRWVCMLHFCVPLWEVQLLVVLGSHSNLRGWCV